MVIYDINWWWRNENGEIPMRTSQRDWDSRDGHGTSDGRRMGLVY